MGRHAVLLAVVALTVTSAATIVQQALQPYRPKAYPSRINALMEDISGEVNEFNDRVTDVHLSGMRTTSQLRLMYEGKLVDQIHELTVLGSDNGLLKANIATHQDAISIIRGMCTRTQEDISALHKEVKDLMSQLSTAEEYAGDALKGKPEESPQLHVLSALRLASVKREKRALKEAMWESLHVDSPYDPQEVEVAEESDRVAEEEDEEDGPLILVQVKSATTPTGRKDNETNIVTFLRAGLEDLRRSQMDTQKRIHEVYRDMLVKGDEAAALLRKSQKKLNSTILGLSKLQPRLTQCMRQLLGVRSFYAHKLVAVREFLSRVDRDVPHLGDADQLEVPFDRVLSLLQSGSTQGAPGKGNDHPVEHNQRAVHQEDADIDAVYKGVSWATVSMQAQLANEQSEYVKHRAYQAKGAFDRTAAQKAEGLNGIQLNDELMSEIAYLKKEGARSKTAATRALDQVHSISLDIQVLKKNVTTLEAFLTQMLLSVEETVIDTSALDELAANDKEAAQALEHQHRLAEVSEAWNSLLDDNDIAPLAMLQRGSHPRKRHRKKAREMLFHEAADSDAADETDVQEYNSEVTAAHKEAEGLLSRMGSTVERLKESTEQFEVAAAKQLEEAFKARESVQRNITKVHDLLEKSRDKFWELATNLKEAKKTAEEARDNILGKDQDLRKFLRLLSHRGNVTNRVLAEENMVTHGHGDSFSASLLQVSRTAARTRELPDTPLDESEAPTGLFQKIAHRAEDFQKKLADMDAEGKQQLMMHRSEYDQRLSDLQVENQKVVTTIEKVEHKMNELRGQSTELRTHASLLLQDKADLLADLASLKKNLTVAVDFAHSTLESAKKGDDDELEVLRELDTADQSQNADKEHRSRLGEISDAAKEDPRKYLFAGDFASSMLQVEVRKAKDTPGALLAGLESGMAELTKEYQQKEAEARREFEAKKQNLLDTHEQLLKHRGNLVEQTKAMISVQTRLRRAVDVLEAEVAGLESKSRKLRAFAQKVSERDVPATRLVKAEPAESSGSESEALSTRNTSEITRQGQGEQGGGSRPWMSWLSKR